MDISFLAATDNCVEHSFSADAHRHEMISVAVSAAAATVCLREMTFGCIPWRKRAM